MKKARTRLAARYLTALRTHLGKKSPGKGDHKGDRAQGLGRAALAGGLVTLDLAIMHEQAVVALASSRDFDSMGNGSLKRAGLFFTQALIPRRKTLLAKNPKRLGLVGMKERIEMVGGSLTIKSTPGTGMAVRAEIPFTPEKTKK